MLEARVCGIPCLINVTYQSYEPPRPHIWDSDLDYYGGWDVEWSLHDTRGRPAPWLERKLSQRDRDRLTDEIVNQLQSTLDLGVGCR